MTKKEAKENWGKIVRATGKLERVRTITKSGSLNSWEISKGYGSHIEGLLIGTRTYSNGSVCDDSEYGWLFSPKGYLEIALIVPYFRAKPVPVLLESVYLSEE